jgi:hypothetical protein
MPIIFLDQAPCCYLLMTADRVMCLKSFKVALLMNSPKKDPVEAIEIKCPRCNRTEILYLVAEDMPKCPLCRIPMVIKELLKEGKSY